jgi:hypothetical protein
MITIQELLYNRELKPEDQVKLVRHKDSGLDLYTMYNDDNARFLTYQSEQASEAYRDAEYIASFIGEEGTLARFIGVFRIIRVTALGEPQTDVTGGQCNFLYEMEEVQGFEDLKERVIIDWGNSSINWKQWIRNEKKVVEIQPGLHYQQFTDYYDFILSFDELKEIVNEPYKDWKKMLSATNGIYLIQDSKTGDLYVGSASGENGIWGRWKDYVRTEGHGGNIKLKELIEAQPDYAKHFKFSILMLLPKTITPSEVDKKETLFKNKLGSKSFGLNKN